ncbi:MAG: hypothetical protein ACK44H_01395 [Candidatus Kryptonium sp.]
MRAIAVLITLLLINPQVNRNKYVSSNFKLERNKPNEFILVVTLKPADGIYINSEPEPKVKFNDSLVEALEVKFDKTEKNYIDTRKPIIVKLKSKTKVLKSLKGELTYFYCSNSEGWCSKFVEKFEVKP